MRRSDSVSSLSSTTSNPNSNGTTPPPQEEETMQIFVKDISGHNTIPLNLPPSTTISTLLTLLSLRTNTPSSSSTTTTPPLRLVHAGKHLSSPTSTLLSYSIPPNGTLHLALPLRGGMPPRKVKCGFKTCKGAAQRIVGDCSFCNGSYCGSHRLLEDHKCVGLEDCKKESYERNAERLESERTVAIRGI